MNSAEAIHFFGLDLWSAINSVDKSMDYWFCSWYIIVWISIKITVSVNCLDGMVLLGNHLVYRNGMMKSVLGIPWWILSVDQLNLDGWRRCLLVVFFTMLMVSSTYLFHHGIGMGNSGLNVISLKYCIQMLGINWDTEETIVASWSC